MEKELRILILEDEPNDAELVERELRKAGMSFASKRVDTREDFLQATKGFNPDLILADCLLPSFDGLSALEIAKQYCPSVPFIFVSGAVGEDFAIETFKRGGTDYVLKQRLPRLVPAVNRALREAKERTQEEQIEGIRVAGVLHDIGKISVPAEILSKPGNLTEIEFSLIKAHPKVGYEILKDIEFPWPVAQVTLQHHERMDGSGYPSGLSGEETLLEAKILGIADVIEAISSHRPYRAMVGIGEALQEISKNKGVLYDPTIADVVLKLFYEKGFKFEK